LTWTSYCSPCADRLGLKAGIDVSQVLQSESQQKSFRKHTASTPSTRVPEQSVFDSGSTEYYEQAIKEAVKQGCVYETTRGPRIVHCPSRGSDFGTRYVFGQYAERVDTVIAVQTSDPALVHSWAEASRCYIGECNSCGTDVP